MNEQNQFQNDILMLKARVFDLNEIIQSKEHELTSHRQLLGKICQVLEIDGSQGVSDSAIIGAINALLPQAECDEVSNDIEK